MRRMREGEVMEVTPFPHTEEAVGESPKYIVFKWSDFYEMMGKLALPPYFGQTSSGRKEMAGKHWDCAPIAEEIDKTAKQYALDDAVVIRRQDVFAAPALEAYANAIQCLIEAIDLVPYDADLDKSKQSLRDIADYFHDQADRSYMIQRKLPD